MIQFPMGFDFECINNASAQREIEALTLKRDELEKKYTSLVRDERTEVKYQYLEDEISRVQVRIDQLKKSIK